MQVSLIIFCSCLSSAYFIYNLSFQSCLTFWKFPWCKKQWKYIDWAGLVFSAPEKGEEHFNYTSHRQAPVPTLTTAVTQGILPWIALGHGTGWQTGKLSCRLTLVVSGFFNTASSSPTINFPASCLHWQVFWLLWRFVRQLLGFTTYLASFWCWTMDRQV